MKRPIALLLFFLAVFTVKGQDIHFSMFHFSPMTLNPAMTGFFDGQYRIVGNYRTQWGSVNTKYETFSGSVDLSLFKGRLDKDYLGVGLVFFRDQAGDLDLTSSSAGLSLAYSKGFGYHTKHSLALGFQGNYHQKSLDYLNARFPDFIDESGTLGTSLNFIDAAGGLMWHIVFRKRLNMYVGGAYHHINLPQQSFTGDPDERLTQRYTGSAGALIEINNKFNVLPSVLYLQQGPSLEVMTGSYLQFVVGEDYVSKTSFSIGFWTRFAQPAADAVILGARFDHNGFTGGLSYDFNISELREASNGRGGLEIALMYIGSVEKRRGFKTIFCPTF